MTGRTTDGALTPARAFSRLADHSRDLRPRAGRGGSAPDEAERARLAGTFGAVLRELRRPSGMSQRTLAERSGVSVRMVKYLEAGQRRPSAAMVRVLAVGLRRRTPPMYSTPPPTAELMARLTEAAGGSLVADTAGGVRRRERRCRAAGWVYVREVRAWEAQRQADRRAEILAGMAPLLGARSREYRRLVRALR